MVVLSDSDRRASDSENTAARTSPRSGDRRAVRGAGDAVLWLQRAMGNRAVARLLQRDPTPGAAQATDTPARPTTAKPGGGGAKPAATPAAKPGPAPQAAEKLPFTIADDPINFQTRRAKIGGGEIYCTGRLSLQGTATFEGETIPDATDLPKPRGNRSPVALWAAKHAREAAEQALTVSAPEGTSDEIVLRLGGQLLLLELDPRWERLEPFVVAGKFELESLDLTFGSLKLAGRKVRLDTTVWITPHPAAGALATPEPASEQPAMAFSFAGRSFHLDDTHDATHNDPSHTVRTGAVGVSASVDRLERELPRALLEHRALKSREQRVALLQGMRPYFGSDNRTIEHFKGIRRVLLHDAHTPSDLWLHDEAATRLEAVREELPPGSMPMSSTGWPRFGHELGLIGNMGDPHDFGMAVDFNAYEMPHLKSDLDKDLVKAVTGKVQMEIPAMTGPYADRPHEGPWSKMAKRTAERGKMVDPAPGSAEAKLLELTVAEAEDASARSEQFKHSLDRTDAEGKIIEGRTEMARLRSSYLQARAKGGPKWTDAQWSQDDREAFTRLVEPWADVVDQGKAERQARLEAAGFKIDALPRGKDLGTEKAKWKDALAAAAKLRAQIKGTPSAPQLKALGPVLQRLRTLLGRRVPDPAPSPPSPPTDKPAADVGTSPGSAPSAAPAAATPLAELDELIAAAKTHLAGFDEISEYDRAAKLRAALDSPEWVFGRSDTPQADDPAPAQMVEHGFFNLRDNSTNKSGAVTVEFIRAMVKHGFVPLGATENPDFMHFELRWWAPASKH